MSEPGGPGGHVFRASSYEDIGSASQYDVGPNDTVCVRMFLCDDNGRKVQCTALGEDAGDAIRRGSAWADHYCDTDSMEMDEWEPA